MAIDVRRTRSRILLTLALGAVTLAASGAEARVYPTNTCVAFKQEEAARYCKQIFRAWAGWERRGDDARRDASLASAADTLAREWAREDQRALRKGVDCGETTGPSTGVQSLVEDGVAEIAAELNAELDLGNKHEARCGAELFEAAAATCHQLVKAEARQLASLGEDRRGRGKLKSKKGRGFGHRKKVGRRCPTGTGDQVEASVEQLAADLVTHTVVSPTVDDTQFTTISPTGVTPYLGLQLSPVCMNGSPYHFFVKRGSVNKVLMYYQGGGACWETLTCSFPACDTDVDPNGGDNPNNRFEGFADRDNPENPFRDWNIVFVSYCSCDVHFGDAAQDYPPHVEHRGFHNARVAEKWAREHFVNPETVFVTGSSAGAYGAWFHAPLLHEVWPASRFYVLADAGNGVITEEFLRTYFPNWDFEKNIPPEFPEIRQVIEEGTGIVGYTKVIAERFPDTQWAHYSAAYDGGVGGQSSFYNIMIRGNNPIAGLSWWNGACPYNEQMRVQAIETAAALPENYRYYIGTGSRHTMWGSDKVYTDTTGGVPTIVDWIRAMLDRTSDWTNVECTNCGLLLPGDPAPAPLRPPFTMVGSDIVIDCVGSPGGAFIDGAALE